MDVDLTFSIMDWDVVGCDEPMGHCLISFQTLVRYPSFTWRMPVAEGTGYLTVSVVLASNFVNLLQSRVNSQVAIPQLDAPRGWTPLMLAAAKGYPSVVAALLALGADTTTRSPSGFKTAEQVELFVLVKCSICPPLWSLIANACLASTPLSCFQRLSIF